MHKAATVPLIFAIAASGTFAQRNLDPPHQGDGAPPRTAADWFRRADDLTNIRMPGARPFHMRVTFHAYSGIDFAPRGKSEIMTGNGTYEEWWLTPRKWRREVSFGSYHAVEVFDGVRKFQASFDYEPSRVLMLLRGLVYSIPRYLVEPQLEEQGSSVIVNRLLQWKVKHLTAGHLPYVELEYRAKEAIGSTAALDAMTWDLLPNGMPVRLVDRFGISTAWQDQIEYGGRAVPRHFDVKALGRDLVTADVTIASTDSPDPSLFQLSGDAAAPGMTLRPFDQWEVPIWPAISMASPRLPNDAVFPAETEIVTAAVVDRHGNPREAEMTGLWQPTGWLSGEEKDSISITAQIFVRSWYQDRFRPGMIDGSPCEVMARVSSTMGHLSWFGGPR